MKIVKVLFHPVVQITGLLFISQTVAFLCFGTKKNRCRDEYEPLLSSTDSMREEKKIQDECPYKNGYECKHAGPERKWAVVHLLLHQDMPGKFHCSSLKKNRKEMYSNDW
uniref:AlNc14C103G6124 protein n=1 Tax=Albugo laibachii Nc14 TaxID=890382 RepID=F0WHR7_9STRA|nr:AlNc14C103G6124 [Albugo laibachii Nc14]|eukprot:CCA20792.1 AlNc14C103G6124 [Albugo laibachii Nc14]